MNIYIYQFNHTLYDLPCTWNYRTDFFRNGELCEAAMLNGTSAFHGFRICVNCGNALKQTVKSLVITRR